MECSSNSVKIFIASTAGMYQGNDKLGYVTRRTEVVPLTPVGWMYPSNLCTVIEPVEKTVVVCQPTELS